MSYQDKSIQCVDCGTTFTFTAGEQEQFAARGYTNEPKRCTTSCRRREKAEHGKQQLLAAVVRETEANGSAPRQMYPVKCATCGKDTEVPFQTPCDKPALLFRRLRKTNPVKRY